MRTMKADELTQYASPVSSTANTGSTDARKSDRGSRRESPATPSASEGPYGCARLSRTSSAGARPKNIAPASAPASGALSRRAT